MILRALQPKSNGDAPKPPQWEADDAADNMPDDLAPAERSDAPLPAMRESKPQPSVFSMTERAYYAKVRKQKEAILEKWNLLAACFKADGISVRFEIGDDGVVWGKLDGICDGGGHLLSVELATITPE